MSIILDLIVLAIIISTVLISAKRGFVRVLIELIGFIAAVFITFTISTPLSNITYDKIIEPPIISSVTSSVNSVAGDKAEAAIENTWKSLPTFVKNNIEKIGITKEKIDNSITNNIGNGTESAVRSASQDVIKPVVTKTLQLIYMVLIIVILMFVVKLLAKFINKLFSFSVIGTANRVLGGIVGLPKGIIIAMVFCLCISLIVSFTKDGFLIFTKEAMEKSWIFSNLSVILLK